MLYLKNKKETRFYKITKIKRIEIERILKQILKNYNDIIFRKLYDIENCIIIEYVIRLLDEILVVEKQNY